MKQRRRGRKRVLEPFIKALVCSVLLFFLAKTKKLQPRCGQRGERGQFEIGEGEVYMGGVVLIIIFNHPEQRNLV